MILSEEANAEKGARLDRLRQQNGFSQTALAEALDVTRQAVSGWERGAAFPSMENLMKLSQLYQVDLAVLTGRAELPSAEPEEPGEPAGEPQPIEPARRLPRRYILWPACLLAVCAIICAALLILHARTQETNEPDETEVIPIEEVNEDPANNFTVDGHIEFEPW